MHLVCPLLVGPCERGAHSNLKKSACACRGSRDFKGGFELGQSQKKMHVMWVRLVGPSPINQPFSSDKSRNTMLIFRSHGGHVSCLDLDIPPMECPPTLPRAITDHTTRLSQVVPLTESAAAARISIRAKHARPPAVPRAVPGSNTRWPKSECFQHASGAVASAGNCSALSKTGTRW